MLAFQLIWIFSSPPRSSLLPWSLFFLICLLVCIWKIKTNFLHVICDLYLVFFLDKHISMIHYHLLFSKFFFLGGLDLLTYPSFFLLWNWSHLLDLNLCIFRTSLSSFSSSLFSHLLLLLLCNCLFMGLFLNIVLENHCQLLLLDY